MYYKMLKDNIIIDAVDSLRYVHRNPKTGRVLRCKDDEGQGILSHDSSVIYQLADKRPLHGKYETVTLEPIDEAEYKRLRDLLDGVEEPEPVEPSSVGTPDTPEEEPVEEIKEPMSLAEMREKIVWLEEMVNELLQKGNNGHRR